jgi:hypothetical protein
MRKPKQQQKPLNDLSRSPRPFDPNPPGSSPEWRANP